MIILIVSAPTTHSTATVYVTPLGSQIVGQSLTLLCEVIVAASRVDIVWSSSNGTELERINNVTSNNNLPVYDDSYTTSQLSTTDEGRVIQCMAVINTNNSVTATGNITLNVTGK